MVKMSEPQYASYVYRRRERLGLRANEWWQTDPRGLLFSMARYKFVAKMLAGKGKVLEVGCGDAFCTRLVQQEVCEITAIDYDPTFTRDTIERNLGSEWPLDVFTHDILSGPLEPWGGGKFDAAYALDVLEHIPGVVEKVFLENICASLPSHGVLIIGTPSAESQAYASAGSIAGHVNCKTLAQLAELMGGYFQNVFMFGMNDETLTTGFGPMCHYLFAIGAGKRV
jgi:2-polyprenyl-3-methyl-5-hydroxy-6-metoxy-1,4-benzoquinol methylase